MLGSFLAKIWRIFISRRFAVALLISITALLFLGILLPTLSYHEPEEMTIFQKKHPILFKMGALFNAPALASSWTFITLNVLLLLSTLFCTIERLKNREYRDPFMAEPKFFRKRFEYTLAEEPAVIAAKAKEHLVKGGWRVQSKEKSSGIFIEAEKGFGYGFWGSIIFHLGFLVLIVGVIASSLTRFNGTILLAEGQTLPLEEKSLLQISRKPRLGSSFLRGTLSLEKFLPQFEMGRHPVDYAARISLKERGKSFTEVVKVNKALKYQGYSLMLENYGFAPLFFVQDKQGKVLLDAYVNLKGREPGSRDAFTVPGENLKVETQFFPNYLEQSLRSQQINPSLEPKNPAFRLQIKRFRGREVLQGVLKKGGKIRLANLSFSFPDLRYWVYLRVTKDSGLPIIFFGFLVGALGLVLRFTFHERNITCRISSKEGSKLIISGRSRYFPALFEEEMKKLSGQIQRGAYGQS